VIVFPQVVPAQSTSYLTFKGHVSLDYKSCADVEVSICQSSSMSAECMEVERFTTKKNGQFNIRLEKNSAYEIHIVKDGFAERVVKVNTGIGESDLSNTNSEFQFEVELSTYPDAKGPITVASVFFDPSKRAFDYRLPAE
jgi:hypothetical protein